MQTIVRAGTLRRQSVVLATCVLGGGVEVRLIYARSLLYVADSLMYVADV